MSERVPILLIDDNPEDRRLAAHLLEDPREGFRVQQVADAATFAGHLAKGGFSAVVTEHTLRWSGGLEILETVKTAFPSCPVVLFTREESAEVFSLALRKGLDGFLRKTNAGFLEIGSLLWELSLRSAPTPSDEDRFSRVLVESLDMGFFEGGTETGITQANSRLAQILNIEGAGGLVGQNPAAWFVSESDRLAWQAALSRGTPLKGWETEIEDARGRRLPVRLHLVHGGAISEGSGAYRGSLERLSLPEGSFVSEAVRQQRTPDRLEDLEQFAAAVSHDLQEPLSLITRYADVLRQRYTNLLPAEAGRFLEHMKDSATRMGARVGDILEYSRAGRGPLTPDLVDLRDALDEALKNLRGPIESHHAVVECGRLPVVEADRSQMVQLFQNLVGNAIKFRGQAPPRVRVTAGEESGVWTIRVADNGIGIEPGEAHRIFGAFQRLHSRSTYPGTGMGLSICKKIVERHGGTIGVASEPGKGATFSIRFPRRQKEKEREEVGRQ